MRYRQAPRQAARRKVLDAVLVDLPFDFYRPSSSSGEPRAVNVIERRPLFGQASMCDIVSVSASIPTCTLPKVVIREVYLICCYAASVITIAQLFRLTTLMTDQHGTKARQLGARRRGE
jgi:hypothetical protein